MLLSYLPRLSRPVADGGLHANLLHAYGVGGDEDAPSGDDYDDDGNVDPSMAGPYRLL